MIRKYNVYGVGNALVDMEFEVTAELLEKLQIDKGVMTLMDEAQQNEVVSKLPPACKQSCGGSAANTVVALSQLGGKGFYSCKVANDEAGAFYLEDLVNCGLDTNLQKNNRPSGVTGKCLVLVTPDADRTMNTFLGITGDISENELNVEAIKDSEYLYLEGYLVSSPTAKSTAIKAKQIAEKAGVKTSLSLSDANMVDFFKEGLFEIIGDGLDLIFANEIEALKIANTDNLNNAFEYLKTICKVFAVTRGAKGSLIFDGENMIEVEAQKVKAVDTVGAGDMYAGSFLYGITNNLNYGDSGKLASATSAELVTSFGPRLNTDKIKSILTEIKG